MSTMPSPDVYEILLPEKRPAERPSFRMADHDGEWFAGEEPCNDRERRPRLAVRIVALVVVSAIAAIVGWQTSYGHAARETLARVSPTLRWMAPASDRIDEMTQSVDRMANDIAASREQITRSIDQLAAGQEEMTRELIKLRAVSQYAPGQAAADGSRRGSRHSR
ncbi:MAG: hypothetical protein FWD12_03295 [Alphaproteobacteria bacterium]|nr:hypothetical protein [Alphaproteobacteria bacterium]